MRIPAFRGILTRGDRCSWALLLLLGALLLPSPATLANTVVKLGAITQISGPQDLDLDGEFLYAINFSTDDPPRTVRGVTFLPDNKKITGATLVGPNQVTPWQSKPEFGASVDANQLEEILADIRWANSGTGERLRATLAVTNAEEYKLQILISGNGNENRRWDIRVNGKDAVDEITSLGASPGQAYSLNRATLYTYQFNSTSNKVVVEMGDLFGLNDGGDRNPIWQALTLKRVFIPPTPDDIVLSTDQFFATQTATISSLKVIDRKSQSTHVLSLVAGVGDDDNAKFTLSGSDLLPRPFDFSSSSPGSVFSIRVRATDTTDPKRFLEKSVTLSIATPHSPAGIVADASSISALAQSGAVVARLTAVDEDRFDRHQFSLTKGDGDTDNLLFSLTGNTVKLIQSLPIGRSELRLRVSVTDLAGTSFSTPLVLPVIAPSVRVNELLASGLGGVPDEIGRPAEFVELYNTQSQWVDLTGFHLTDQAKDLTRWTFPSGAIAPNGFLVVLADGLGTAPTGSSLLHASFSLDATGSKVTLSLPDGATIASQLGASEFFPGVSYGVKDDGTLGYFPTPTPGSTNAPAARYGMNQVGFSQTHGFFSKSFNLTLTSSVPGSVIRYTTDGTMPSTNRGSIYTNSFVVKPNTNGLTRGTKIVRAIALHPDAAYVPVATQTYLFINGESGPQVDGVVSQSQLVTSITKHAVYGPLMDDALLALPSVSLVMAQGPDGSEQTASLELFDPAGQEEGFQIDCGIKASGTTSLASPKLSMAAKFRSDYGRSKLVYPMFARGSLFPEGAASSFKELRLRGHSHDTFFWLATVENPPVPYGDPPVNRSGDAQLARNPWIDEMQIMMGQPGKHGRQVHLYLNGAYHGLYHIHEHADDDYMASYFPGGSSDYHFSAAALSGSDHPAGDTWRDPWTAMKASLKNYAEAVRWVDVTNLCDYMILSFYAGNDWDWSAQHNWAAAGPRFADRGGWKFFQQDSDITLQDIAADCTDQDVPDGIFTALMAHSDFRSLFRDRVYHHCYNDGALTPARAGGLYEIRMNEITNAVVAETARWQPSSSVSPLPWDRDQEWVNEWKYIRETYFPQRTVRLIQQLRKHTTWWPLDPPELTQLSGIVPVGFGLRASSLSGVMYYTTDGTDPRLPGGKINPAAIRLEVGVSTNKLVRSGTIWRFLDTGVDPAPTWKDLEFDDQAWRSGATEIGYGDGGEGTVAGFVDTDPVVAGIQRNITTYFRKSFDAGSLANVQSLKLRVVRDDGVVIYLNGVEIYRNNLPTGTITSQTRALAEITGSDESTFQEIVLDLASTPLRPTGNLLAAEIHQRSPLSTDMSFNCELIAYSFAPNAQITINQPLLIRARLYSGTDWSAIVDASLGTDGVPSASAANLVISEIHYNPLDSSANEFLEFMNTSSSTIDLSELILTQAVSFRFSRPTLLAPGERLVVARDLALFDARYRTNSSPFYHEGIRAVGPWLGSLANEGETIRLLNPDGSTLFECAYGTADRWPSLAAGHGSSLELIHPELAPAHTVGRTAWLNEPRHWRASSEFHGTPGWEGRGWDGSVVINELLAATTAAQRDAIEFKNLSESEVDISGWWISDSTVVYKKYVFPTGTRIQPHQWLTLTESDFNHPGSPSNPAPFAFSSSGDQAFLVEANSDGVPLRFRDALLFGPMVQDAALGRWPDGTGPLRWLSRPTLGGVNAVPVAGYSAWATTAFPPGMSAEAVASSGDPDGDGVINAAEYAFAMDPLNPESSPLQLIRDGSPEGLTFVYQTRSQSSDLTYRVDVSEDLVTWDVSGSRIVTLSQIPEADGSTKITARLRFDGGAAHLPRSFLRIVALP